MAFYDYNRKKYDGVIDNSEHNDKGAKIPKMNPFAALIGGIAAFFVLIILLFSCVCVVEVGEVAVVTEFGSIKSFQTSGLHLKFPTEDYNIIDVTQQTIPGDYSTATKDNQSVTQSIAAQVKVRADKAESLYETFKGTHMDGIVPTSLADAVKAATAKYTLEEVISNRNSLGNSILEEAQKKLSKYGIDVVSIEITNVDIPTAYREAVEKKKVAQQELETAKVQRDKAKVEAQKNRIEAASLDEKNIQRMKIDLQQQMIDKWDGKLPTYMSGSNSGLNALLNVK